MPVAIAANNLAKHFGPLVAVDNVSLSIPHGEIFGLLGPNAAGKSTLIRLLSGILSADGGSAEILGYDLATHSEAIKKRIGYVSQHFALYPELTVAENLNFYSAIYQPISGAEQARLLEQYGLTPYRRQRAGLLSGGYKRRLSIACAMAHDPKLIFLDEPTAGIDPVTRKELWEIFYSLAAAGKTLFVTTHYMEEAERCNRLAFINAGRLVAEGTPTEIKGLLSDYRVYACRLRYDPVVVAALSAIDGVLVLNQFGDELRIITGEWTTQDQLAAVVAHRLPAGSHLHLVESTIEDVFITLTRESPPP